VILYELITGRPPFFADNFMGILTKHMFDAPHAPSEVAPLAGISPEVEALVLKALQKDRDLRYQSMQEFMAAMQAIGTGAPPVVVVPEARVRPASGGRPIEFNRVKTGPIGPIMATGEATMPTTRRSRIWAIAASLAIVGASATTMAMVLSGDVPPPPALADRADARRRSSRPTRRR
jgi:hypothetical protein